MSIENSKDRKEREAAIAALRERLQDVKRILHAGISEDALALLKEEFEFNLPVTEWKNAAGERIEMSAEERVQRALYRDGARSVISFIERYR